MVRILGGLLAVLLVWTNAKAVTLNPAASVVQGGYTLNTATPSNVLPTANASNRKFLQIVQNTVTSGDYYMLYVMAGSSALLAPGQYQVPSGKAAYCTSVSCSSANGLIRYQFGYGSGPGTDNNSSAPPGAQIFGVGNYFGFACQTANISTYNQLPLFLTFPSGSFPFARLTAGSNFDLTLFLDCIEQ